MPDIMHLIRFNSPPSVVYAMLTTREGVRAWWTPDADLDAVLGSIGEFRFYDGKKVTRVRVDELAPSMRVAWTVVDSFRPEWVGTTITFELRPAGGGTELLFAQRGYPHADENYAVCTTGWGIYFGRMQQHLEASQTEIAAIHKPAEKHLASAPSGVETEMSLKSISHETPIEAQPTEIYAALTEPRLLAKWWIPDTRGESEVGKSLEFWIGDFCQRMEILELDPNRRVRWRPADQGSADWARTEIEFDIRRENEKCWVRFRHGGLRSDVEKLPYYSTSWAVFLLSLKDLMEAGKGFPFPNRWINQ